MSSSIKAESIQVENVKFMLRRRQSGDELVRDSERNTPKGSLVPSRIDSSTNRDKPSQIGSESYSEGISPNKLSIYKDTKSRTPSLFFNANETEPIHNKEIRSGGHKVSTILIIEESLKNSQSKKPKGWFNNLPKKQLFISFALLVVSIIAIIVGSVYVIASKNPHNGIAFWIIGGVCGLPGMFYACKFCKICYTKSAEARTRALEQIPRE